MIKYKNEGGQSLIGKHKRNIEGKPLVSIITIVRNGEKYLENAIKSVINQTYENIEYIIIDGRSTDGTLDIIATYNESIDYWISEADSGISDAFNKGVNLANGELIGIVNSDDWLESNAVEIIVSHLDKKISVYCGNLKLYDRNLNIIKTRKSRPFFLFAGMYIMHPTVFIKKDVYKNNKFNTSLKIAMDYDLLLRLRTKGYKIKNINEDISNMMLGGVSCNVQKMRVEEKLIMKNNLPFLLYQIAKVKLIVEPLIMKVFFHKNQINEAIYDL